MAQSHDVYLGMSQSAVAGATTTSPEFLGNRTEPNYVPATLVYDTIYYWRIDERNADATATQGGVWSFRTVPFVPVTDPSLVGWWKLDDGQGKIVFDWSTRGNHGTYLGDPNWIVGTLDGALAFTGYEYVECGNAASLNITAAITVATWVRTNDAGNSQNNPYVAKGNSSYALRQNTGNAIEFSVYDGAALQAVVTPVDGSFNGVWHHLAGTCDGSSLNLYVDGQPQATAPYAGSIATNTFGVNFARDAQQTWCWYDGALDDVRIYSRALAQAEIRQIMRGDPLLAWNPSPANGAVTDVQKAVPLSWSAGDGAAQHDVYLGTDAAAVGLAAASDTTGIYRGRQTATTYTPSAALEWGPTYAWRVDEVQANGTVSKGRTWTFTVADYLIVDDFESYNDLCNRIFFTWLGGAPDSGSLDTSCPRPPYAGNGTGSAVGNYDPPFAEPTIIHSGQQSMPVFYDNTAGASVSEAIRTFDVAQDWTFGGVRTLVLYFCGDPANGVGQLYVKINNTQVAYTGSAEALARPLWKQWNIDLASLTGLQAVQTLTVGVSGAVRGTLYVDDIRLYRVAPPVPVSVDPGTTGLAAYYTFEGDVKDSSGRNNNGVTVNDPMYGDSLSGMGKAVQLDGVNDYVELPIGTLVSTLTSATVATWVNFDPTTSGSWSRVFDFGTDPNRYMFLTPRQGTAGTMRFAIRASATTAESNITAPAMLPSGWHHVAVVIDGPTKTAQLYQDDRVVASGTITNLPADLGTTTQNWLGRSQFTADGYLGGALDDLRIYNRALTADEVRYLAGDR